MSVERPRQRAHDHCYIVRTEYFDNGVKTTDVLEIRRDQAKNYKGHVRLSDSDIYHNQFPSREDALFYIEENVD